MTSAAPATIVFDGRCLMCEGGVQFLLRADKQGRYRFAAMQGATGRALLLSQGLNPDDPLSFLLQDEKGAYIDSTAILRVLTGLGGAWKLCALGWLVPRPLRDALYRLVARNRYRWFGQKAECRLPSPEQSARFLA